MVYYEYAGDSVRHDVFVSSGVNTYLLTGLPIGGVHSISIVAVRHLPSDVVGPVDPSILLVYVTCYIHIMFCTAVVEPPEVTLSGSGSRVAGTSYTLTCTVTPPTGVQFSVPPTIQCPGLTTAICKSSQISSGIYVCNITLNPLQETHSGQYSCSASYSLGNISSEVVTEKMAIIVLSEFCNYLHSP